MIPVVVLGMFDTGLYTLRAIGRQGISVYGIDYDARKSGFRSRYGKQILCSKPEESDEILKVIIRVSAENKKLLLIPSSDEFLNYLLVNSESLPQNCVTVQPSPDVLKMILDKRDQLNYVKQMGVNVPQYYESTTDKLGEVLERVTYPVFIKPVKIHEWKKIFKNKGIKLDSENEAIKQMSQLACHKQDVLIQEIIPGPITNNYEASFYFDREGRCRQKFVVQKIRQWPMEFGSATATRTVENSIVEHLSRNLLEAMSWRGFANVEFKLDPRDNSYQFIEINARVWQQIGHAESVGINFPIMPYLDCANEPFASERPYPLNSYWIDASSDFLSVYHHIKREWKYFIDVVKSYYRASNYGLMASDDLRPFFHSLGLLK